MSKLADELNKLHPDCDTIPLYIGGFPFHGLLVRDLKAAIRAVEQPSRDAALETALRNLLDQVNKFCEEQGEADFYTGEAIRALKAQPAEPAATPSQEAKPVESGDGAQPNAPAPAAATE